MRPSLNFALFDRWLLQQILDAIGQPPLRLVLRGREEVSTPGVSPVATLVIQDRPTLLRMALNAEIGFGDGYAEGRIDIEGDLTAALEATYLSISQLDAGGWRSRTASRWMERW